MRSWVRVEEAEIGADERSSEHQYQPAGAREERAKWYRSGAVVTSHDDHGQTNHGACSRGDQDDWQQHLPAEPRPERREQLEVAVAHSLLSGEKAEQMIDAPQAH